MQMWLGDRVDADVTVGGRYRIENDADDGVMYAHEGEYLVLEPEDRIVQTFEAGLVGDDSNAENPYQNEYLEITLTKLDNQTTGLTFENAWDGPALSAEDEAATRQAWEEWLDGLERSLAEMTA